MRNLIWLLALIVLLLVQQGILQPLHITSVHVVLIVTAIASLLSDFDQGLIIVLLGGLILDMLSPSLDGVVSISLVTVFLILHLILNEFLAKEPNQLILFSTVAVSTILFFAIFMILDQTVDAGYQLRVKMPMMVISNLIITYPIFKFYTWIQNLVSKLPSNESRVEI